MVCTTRVKIALVLEPLWRAWLETWRLRLTCNERPINPYRVIREFMNVVDTKDAIVTRDSRRSARARPPLLYGFAPAWPIG